MRSSYKKQDVIILLKDITGLVEPLDPKEREKTIQRGIHYSAMLPLEYIPSEKYIEVYNESLKIYSKEMANSIANLCDKIVEKKGLDVVLVSLARAGIPIGILIKRYMKFKYNIDVGHYAISIIRDIGIDDNAMKYILDRHNADELVFVDGWTGKGVIMSQLEKSLQNYKDVSPNMAVVSDPANISDLYGTKKDILIPSSCLNATVSGLISRTFFRKDIISESDFHGAIYYENLKKQDVSYEFIRQIESKFSMENEKDTYIPDKLGIEEVKLIMKNLDIKDINLIKPGIGETTRVLLRRTPHKVIIDKRYKQDTTLSHIKRLSQEKNVPIYYEALSNYKCIGIIKKISDV